MAFRMRAAWSSRLAALAASGGSSYALAASLGAHALLAAAVTLVPPLASERGERSPEPEHVLEVAALEAVPPPAEPSERPPEPAAARLPALDREGPPVQRVQPVQRGARQQAAASASSPAAAPSLPEPSLPALPVALALSAQPIALPPAAPTPAPSVAPLPPAAGARELVYAEGDVDRAPRLLAAPKPPYPAQALRQGREGDVVLTLLVDPTGSVQEASVARRAGRGFDEAALSAARGLRFHPGSKGGRSVAVRVSWTCRFRLE